MVTPNTSTKRLDDLLKFCRVAGIHIDPRIELRDEDEDDGTNDTDTLAASTGISVYARDVYIPSETSLVTIPKSAVLSVRSCRLAKYIPFAPYGLEAQLALALALYGELLQTHTSRWAGYLQSLPKRIDAALLWGATPFSNGGGDVDRACKQNRPTPDSSADTIQSFQGQDRRRGSALALMPTKLSEVAFSDSHHNIEDDGSASRAIEEETDSKLARQIARGTEIDKAVRAALGRADKEDGEGERAEPPWRQLDLYYAEVVKPLLGGLAIDYVDADAATGTRPLDTDSAVADDGDDDHNNNNDDASMRDHDQHHHRNLRPSVQGFYHAFLLVSSRAFLVDAYHGLAMVPVADAFNHEQNHQVHLESEYDICATCGSLKACIHDSDSDGGSDDKNDVTSNIDYDSDDDNVAHNETWHPHTNFPADVSVNINIGLVTENKIDRGRGDRAPDDTNRSDVGVEPEAEVGRTTAAPVAVTEPLPNSAMIGFGQRRQKERAHKSKRNRKEDTDTEYNSDEDIENTLEMISNLPIAPHTEVFNTYGAPPPSGLCGPGLSNAALVASYGFMLDEPRPDGGAVSWSMRELVAFAQDRLDFLLNARMRKRDVPTATNDDNDDADKNKNTGTVVVHLRSTATSTVSSSLPTAADSPLGSHHLKRRRDHHRQYSDIEDEGFQGSPSSKQKSKKPRTDDDDDDTQTHPVQQQQTQQKQADRSQLQHRHTVYTLTSQWRSLALIGQTQTNDGGGVEGGSPGIRWESRLLHWPASQSSLESSMRFRGQTHGESISAGGGSGAAVVAKSHAQLILDAEGRLAWDVWTFCVLLALQSCGGTILGDDDPGKLDTTLEALWVIVKRATLELMDIEERFEQVEDEDEGLQSLGVEEHEATIATEDEDGRDVDFFRLHQQLRPRPVPSITSEKRYLGASHASSSGSYNKRAETDLDGEPEEEDLGPDVHALVRTAAMHVVGLCRARRAAIVACVPVSELLSQREQLQPHGSMVATDRMKHSNSQVEEGKAAGAGEVQQRGKVEEEWEEGTAAILGLALDVSGVGFFFLLFNSLPWIMWMHAYTQQHTHTYHGGSGPLASMGALLLLVVYVFDGFYLHAKHTAEGGDAIERDQRR